MNKTERILHKVQLAIKSAEQEKNMQRSIKEIDTWFRQACIEYQKEQDYEKRLREGSATADEIAYWRERRRAIMAAAAEIEREFNEKGIIDTS